MKIIIIIAIVVVLIIVCYQFIVRPIQRDRKLESCLYGAGVTWVETANDLREYKDDCYRKYGK